MSKWQNRSEEGFTLVELMVVVLIIAILIAVAIPTFLGARRGAQDRAAQIDLRNFLPAERSYYVDNTAYTTNVADLQALDPSVRINADPSIGTAVSLNLVDTSIVCGTRVSDAGNMFSLWESAAAGTFYGTADLTGGCPAVAPGGFTTTTW